jgi:lipopolysaccharide export system ATP-binding protein
VSGDAAAQPVVDPGIDGERRILMEGLVKHYGSRTVVDGVSAAVRTGEIVGLLGPNGAGKTTTFYMVVGLVKPDGGKVTLHNGGVGLDLTGLPMYRRARSGIGYLAQENSIFRKLTVGDNIRLIWEMHGVTRREQERRLPELLDEFGLTRLIDSRADSLSGGERRRVEIARALATEPAFLLLDEPFTGIDPIAVADIQLLIRQLRGRGLGILITDHQVRETLAIVDRAYILNEGRIVVSGSAQEVLESPAARQFYLGEGFRL